MVANAVRHELTQEDKESTREAIERALENGCFILITDDNISMVGVTKRLVALITAFLDYDPIKEITQAALHRLAIGRMVDALRESVIETDKRKKENV